MFNSKLKIVKVITEWVVFTLLIIVFILTVSPFLPIKNAPKSFIVQTGSMLPAIKPGSLSFVRALPDNFYREGDIIAFNSPNDGQDIIIHRIDSITGSGNLFYTTKGDNNTGVDNWTVSNSNIIGKQILNIPYLGNVSSFIKTPLGFGVLVVLPALVFIGFQILNIYKYIELEVQKRSALNSGTNSQPTNPNQTTSIIPTLLFFLAGLTLISLSTVRGIHAVFMDTVLISDMTITTGDFEDPEPLIEEGELFLIGDKEDSPLDNPSDELNWRSDFPSLAVHKPPFDDPYIVGDDGSEFTDFPWNSNFAQSYATDFDIEFEIEGTGTATAVFKYRWSPGTSGSEKKRVYLIDDEDNSTLIHESSLTGQSENPAQYWHSGNNRGVKTHEFTSNDFELEEGTYRIRLEHVTGDGTYWDWVSLEVLSVEE